MFRATIIRVDDSVLLADAEIRAHNSKRGLGDGHVWRGVFSIPLTLRPTMGETIHFRLKDNSLIAAVITDVEPSRVHFRARGKAPRSNELPDTLLSAIAG
jgi:hypothetical protein